MAAPSWCQRRSNGAVKLAGLQGYCAEAGWGSYSSADGPAHGQARSLPSARYAVLGTVESNEAPVDHADGTDVGNPARDCALCQDASRLGDAVLDSAMLRGALTAVRIRRARGGGLRRFARSRPLDCIRLRRTRGHVRRRVLWGFTAAACSSFVAG